MHISFPLFALLAVAASDVYGMKLEHQKLAKRQTISYQQCTQTCQSYSTQTQQCSSLISTGSVTSYGACICSNTLVQAIIDCVNCGVAYSASQTDIATIEYVVNTYAQACGQLGYPINIPITTQPAVTFPCTIGFSTYTHGGTGTASVNPAAFTSASTTSARSPTTTSAAQLIPSNLSLDPSDLSLISSLLGGVTTT